MRPWTDVDTMANKRTSKKLRQIRRSAVKLANAMMEDPTGFPPAVVADMASAAAEAAVTQKGAASPHKTPRKNEFPAKAESTKPSPPGKCELPAAPAVPPHPEPRKKGDRQNREIEYWRDDQELQPSPSREAIFVQTVVLGRMGRRQKQLVRSRAFAERASRWANYC